MTIERRSFPQGLPFKGDTLSALQSLVQSLRREGRRENHTLQPGEYNLTPEQGIVPFKYSLLVHEDGTATVRMISHMRRAYTTDVIVNWSSISVGGSSQEVNADHDSFVVAGPKKSNPETFNVFEVITYSK